MAKDKETYFTLKVKDRIDLALLEARRIFISTSTDNASAQDIIRKIWYLELTDPGKPILFVINSPGGSVDDGFAIWDQFSMITSPVTTLITGLAASMGSVLSLCARNGQRFATPHSRIMIHQPSMSGVVQGQATDLEIHAKEIIKTRDTLIKLYMNKTGKDYETIDRAMERDTWMTPEEAKAYNLIDGVVTSYEELNKLMTSK